MNNLITCLQFVNVIIHIDFRGFYFFNFAKKEKLSMLGGLPNVNNKGFKLSKADT